MRPAGARASGGLADRVAGSHVTLRDAPARRELDEFEVVAAPDRKGRRYVAFVGRRSLHLDNDVDLPLSPLAVCDDHEVAETVR